MIVLTGITVVTAEGDLAGQLVTSGPQLVIVRTLVSDTTEMTVSGPPEVVGDEFSEVCGCELVAAGLELLVRG